MEGNKHVVQVVETTSRNKHKRDLDFIFCMKRLLRVFLKQKEGRWGQKCYLRSPSNDLQTAHGMPCTMYFGNGKKIPTTKLEWESVLLVSITRAVSDFSPLEKYTH